MVRKPTRRGIRRRATRHRHGGTVYQNDAALVGTPEYGRQRAALSLPELPDSHTTGASLLYRGPDAAAGDIVIGREVDSGADVHYHLLSDRQMNHGAVIGDPGTGVSNLLTVLAVGARATMPTVTVYIDGHRSPANRALTDQASVLVNDASPADTSRIAIAALERVAAARAALIANIRAADHIAAGLPNVLVLIKGAHDIFGTCADRWARLLHLCPWLGIGVVAATRTPLLSSFGGNTDLFDQFKANVVTFRCSGSAALDRIQGQLPSGVARLRNQLQPFATFHLTEPSAEATAARRRWLRTYPDAALDGPTRDAFGDLVRRGLR